MTTVLIIGGYGTFGRRLVRLLSDIDGLCVLVGGRNPDKAQAVINDLDGSATLIAQCVDRAQPIAPQLDRSIDCVVDAVGPFQAYGDTRDIVFDFCADHDATYIDLSDDPAFCAYIMARADGAPMSVATGWSTFSALTGAIVDELGGGPSVAGLVPNPQQPMGRAVIESVLTYAGKPVGSGYGLTRTRRNTVIPPGAMPMRRLLFSNVATPDTVLLDPQSTGWVAPQPILLHWSLILMARLARWNLFPPLALFAGPIHWAQSLVRIGEPRGGLVVEANGKSFHLIGEGEAGPDVPVIPAAALIEAIHQGETFEAGWLRPGAAFPLSRLTSWFDRLDIHYGTRDERGPLYARVLGGAMVTLPAPIQTLHEGGQFTGRATVTRGRNPIGRLIANLFGLPKAGDHQVDVSITTDDQGVERWSRTYSGREMLSFQSEGKDREAGTVIERFGPIAVQLGLAVEGERLRYDTRGWSILGIPLPRFLVPGGDVHERVDDQGRFHFHVDMIAPGFGRLVRYEGWLERVD